MITRVLDADGNVTHDCAASGCEVSWDGFSLVEIPASDDYPAFAVGDPLPGRTDPDPNLWLVDGDTATAKDSASE